MDSRSRRTRKIVPKSSSQKGPVVELIQTVQIDGTQYTLIDIRVTGDILLDVTFDNQKSTSQLSVSSTENEGPRTASLLKTSTGRTNTRVLYRIRLDTLKKTSKYFELLLGSDKFSEGKNIAAIFQSLQARNILPTEAEPSLLPRISITDDDDATRIAGRELVFADMLRILHGAETNTRFTIPYVASLAIMADRFDCTPTVGRYVRASKRMPWPQTFGVMTVATEELLRQKILIAWLLDDNMRLAGATRELITRGSSKWTADDEETGNGAVWWDLQDGLEAELLYRRTCILNTISSIQTYFLSLYTSRDQQCQHFYDSSKACDSYQLGEMIKFFAHKSLLSLVPLFSADSSSYAASYVGDIETLITILRQCPSYQIDAYHRHCGLRARILPPLSYIEAMLTQSNVGIEGRAWKGDRRSATWEVGVGEQSRWNDQREEGGVETGFRFTQKVLSEHRCLADGLGGSKRAKALFTAGTWDWSPVA